MCTNRHELCDPGLKCHRLICLLSLSLSHFNLEWFAASCIIIIISSLIILIIIWLGQWRMIIAIKIIYSLFFTFFVCLFVVAGSAPSLHHEEHASYLQVVFVFLILLLSLQTKLFTCPYISLQRLWIEDSCPNNGIHFIRHNLHQFPKQKKRSQVMSIKIHRSSSKNLIKFQPTDWKWPPNIG